MEAWKISLATAFRKKCQYTACPFKSDRGLQCCNWSTWAHRPNITDLSKAFDCLLNQLLLSKLNFYGLSKNACPVLTSYLQNRRQRVELGSALSELSILQKVVPQGSVLGPLLFLVLINKLFFKMCYHFSLYNNADDNTIRISHSDTAEMKQQLQDCSKMAKQSFESDQMQVNRSKFRFMVMKAWADRADHL